VSRSNPKYLLLSVAVIISGLICKTDGLAIIGLNEHVNSKWISSGSASSQRKKENELEKKIYSNLKECLKAAKYEASRKLADSLEAFIKTNPGIEKNDLVASLYYIGLSYSLNKMELKSFPYFNRAISLIDNDSTNILLGNIYYNLGFAYNRIDDHIKSAYYFSKSVRSTINIKGKNSKDLIEHYVSLSISSINTGDYKKAIEYSNTALKIVNLKPDSVDSKSLALIYLNKGVALSRTSDYFQASINFNKALENYSRKNRKLDDYYINLLTNIAANDFNLGEVEKSTGIYEKDLNEIINFGSFDAYIYIRNYSLMLAGNGKESKGEQILAKAVESVRKYYPASPNLYYKALSDYAEYLLSNRIDSPKALQLYGKCFDYVKTHSWNVSLNNEITLGYAMALLDNDKPLVALDTVCSLLFRSASQKIPQDKLMNPDFARLKSEKKTLDILKAKYQILDQLATSGKDTTLLLSRAVTAEMLIDILEAIRLEIGEEQSRLILGTKYRNAYLDAIRSYKVCFDVTGRNEYLEKAFILSERSKAASLLASMREVNAMKAAVPESMMTEERELQKEMNFYESRIEQEKNSEKPDTGKLSFWESSFLSSVEKKHNLISSFEKKYPDYFSIKTSTIVLNPDGVKKLIGKNKDYLSYLVSDNTLYIFLVNSKETRLFSVGIDSSFLRLVTKFRRLLSEPNLEGSAKNEFNLFQQYGYRLYSSLILPVADHLASDELVISTDNLLSYFPFETLVTENKTRTDLYYSRLPYLMNKFRISYVYSATQLSESGKTKATVRNRSVSFAPSYQAPILVDSLSVNRQQTAGMLPDLRFAREEAEYVAELTSGKLFLDKSATKSNYLTEAGKYDIIHLAMHTVLNSRNPVSSGMIFSSNDSSGQYLQPYEIYSVIIKAKMVVLSSCYTGAGTLYAGEGVLSLARGFISSGSQSVVMSLWEINDRSGTEIMKEFYKRIKSGKSKSYALREARISYLKSADMLRAHPYFWSTLVIYGDDSAIYRPFNLITAIAAGALILLIAGFVYFRKR
jgi:CHAT domain-containing protein